MAQGGEVEPLTLCGGVSIKGSHGSRARGEGENQGQDRGWNGEATVRRRGEHRGTGMRRGSALCVL